MMLGYALRANLTYIHRDLAAYPSAERGDPRALDSFEVGCHHRITRRARVEWLARNRNAGRTGEPSA